MLQFFGSHFQEGSDGVQVLVGVLHRSVRFECDPSLSSAILEVLARNQTAVDGFAVFSLNSLAGVQDSRQHNLDRVAAVEALNERESKMSTGIMHSVAVPHALVSSMKKTVGAIGVSKSGIDYDALDKAPVHVVFMILGADGETEKHIQILKQLALVLQNPGIVDKIVRCETASDVFNLISKTEESLSE